MKKKILVIDDDPHIREVVRFALEQAHFKVYEAVDGRKGMEQFKARGADLIVLDVMMPEMDGIEVCRELRKKSEVPILFLSSKASEVDRILGLEMGGDDYLTKPFSPRELVARINVILKRLGKTEEEETKFSHGKVSLDSESHKALFGKSEVALTATEFKILKALLERPSKVFSRADMMAVAYGADIVVSDRTIDSHVRGVRDKFEKAGCKSAVETVHGVGYRLGAGA